MKLTIDTKEESDTHLKEVIKFLESILAFRNDEVSPSQGEEQPVDASPPTEGESAFGDLFGNPISPPKDDDNSNETQQKEGDMGIRTIEYY